MSLVREEINIRVDVEEHAIRLAVAETLALGISLAESTACSKGVLRAAGLEVVCGCGLNVGDDAATRFTGWRARLVSMGPLTIHIRETHGDGLDTRVEDGCMGLGDGLTDDCKTSQMFVSKRLYSTYFW
jgi:hypothetical protein